MARVLIFFALWILVVCSPIPHLPAKREEIELRKNKLKKDLVDCLLKTEISAELKKQIEENNDVDLRKILLSSVTNSNSNDRELIRKCRRESFEKMREYNFGRFDGRTNITESKKI